MKEQIHLARSYARILWRYRWAALGFSAIVCVAGWIYVISMPNTFEVNAKVFVDTRSMLRPLLKGLAIDNNALRDSAMLMKRTLLTRPNLEEVARRTDLDLTTETPRQFEQLIISLAERIRLSGTSSDNVYEIKFEDSDAERAKRVVDELLNTFLETALGSSRTDTAVTQKFLDAQIVEYEQRLVQAEERLKTFKQKNVGMMPGAEDDYFRRLETTKLKVREAELIKDEAVRRRDALKKRLEQPDRDTGVDTRDPNLIALSEYTPRIDSMQQALDDLLLQYTEKHPEIVSLRSSIEDLKARRQVELKEIAESVKAQGDVAAAGQSEALITTRLAVAEAEGEVAALQTRVAEYSRQLEDLERLIDTIPEVEAELARLNRDYGLNKEQYDELKKRRESARLSEEVDATADDVKLKVIEPPRVPLVPSGPKRILLFTAVFFVGLGAGGAIAFVLSQLQPRFYTTEELKEFAHLPILGAVSYLSTRRYRTERRMELATFGLIFMVLASLYGGLVSLESLRYDLHGKLMSVLERQL